MAGGSSSLGFLRNEVVLGKMWSQSVLVESVRVRNVVKVVAFPVLCRKNRTVVVANVSKSNPLGESQFDVASVSVSKEGGNSVVGKDIRILETGFEVKVDIDGNGGGDVLGGSGNGRFSSGGGGGGGGDGGDDNGDDKEEDEFGPILKFEEVMKETEARGVSLPSDMLEAAKSVGIRKLLLLRYLDLQWCSACSLSQAVIPMIISSIVPVVPKNTRGARDFRFIPTGIASKAPATENTHVPNALETEQSSRCFSWPDISHSQLLLLISPLQPYIHAERSQTMEKSLMTENLEANRETKREERFGRERYMDVCVCV